jgi:hypothetical protein
LNKYLVYFLKGYYGPPAPYYGQPYHGRNDLSEQEGGYNDFPFRGNRGYRGGRGRGRGRGAWRGRGAKSEKFV